MITVDEVMALGPWDPVEEALSDEQIDSKIRVLLGIVGLRKDPQLQRRFAHDCAQRALSRVRKRHPAAIAAVKLALAAISMDVPAEELFAAREAAIEVVNEMDCCAERDACVSAAAAIMDAPERAAYCAALSGETVALRRTEEEFLWSPYFIWEVRRVAAMKAAENERQEQIEALIELLRKE